MSKNTKSGLEYLLEEAAPVDPSRVSPSVTVREPARLRTEPMLPDSGRELQRHRRLEVEFSVQVDLPKGLVDGVGRNISEGGMFIEAPRTPAPGEVVNARLTILARKFHVLAEVVWCRSRDPGLVSMSPGMGLKFLEIGESDRTFLSSITS
jgi:hypothetical protein